MAFFFFATGLAPPRCSPGPRRRARRGRGDRGVRVWASSLPPPWCPEPPALAARHRRGVRPLVRAAAGRRAGRLPGAAAAAAPARPRSPARAAAGSLHRQRAPCANRPEDGGKVFQGQIRSHDVSPHIRLSSRSPCASRGRRGGADVDGHVRRLGDLRDQLGRPVEQLSGWIAGTHVELLQDDVHGLLRLRSRSSSGCDVGRSPRRIAESDVDQPVLLDPVAVDEHIAVHGHRHRAHIVAAVLRGLDLRQVGARSRRRIPRMAKSAQRISSFVLSPTTTSSQVRACLVCVASSSVPNV